MLIDRKIFYSKLCDLSFKSDTDLVAWAFESGKVISFTNPVNFMFLANRNDLMSGLNHIFCDGILAVKWFSFLTGRTFNRYSFDFTSLAGPVMDYCSKNNKSIYFVGSDEESIGQFMDFISCSYPDLNIIGYRNGYLADVEIGALIDELAISQPDAVICGMGCPKQEEFCVQLANKLSQATIFTCGGFIHQYKDGKNYFPAWVHKYHLRMPYRFWREKHTRSRILFYPKFLFITLLDFFRLKTIS